MQLHKLDRVQYWVVYLNWESILLSIEFNFFLFVETTESRDLSISAHKRENRKKEHFKIAIFSVEKITVSICPQLINLKFQIVGVFLLSEEMLKNWKESDGRSRVYNLVKFDGLKNSQKINLIVGGWTLSNFKIHLDAKPW